VPTVLKRGTVILVLLAAAVAQTALSGGWGLASHRHVRSLLPSGWRITPAGRVITVPNDGPGLTGPWGVAITPDGRKALVTSSGAAVKNETVEMFDLASGRRTSLRMNNGVQGESVFYGVTFSPDGKRAWASGGGQGVVHSYNVSATGRLSPAGDIPAGFFPAGIAYGHTPRGDRLYVANNLGGKSHPNITDEDPPGHTVTVIDPSTGAITRKIDLGRPLDPMDVAFNNEGSKAYVTNWVGRSVSVIDTATQQKVGGILLSPETDPLLADHPTGIAANPVSDELYVANANSDTVSVIDSRTDTLAATIPVGLDPRGPKGSTPVRLTVSPDGRLLFVADAGENAIVVVDTGSKNVLGFIPTAWYPSDVKVTPDGRRLVVVNTYGSGAQPNPCGPFTPLGPIRCPDHKPHYYPGTWYDPPLPEDQYAGTMIKGSVEVIGIPQTRWGLLHALGRWTAQVRANNRVDARHWPEPPWLHGIKHVIYVIKENRTYDEVFGSLPEGNGDPALNLFGNSSAPNHRALASKFVLLDNFYVDAQVSQDGHPWSTQGVATDYTRKVWPFDYAWAYYRAYDSEYVPFRQQFPSEPLASDPTVRRSAAAATAGYIWDDAWNHGVSFRNYGESTNASGVCNPTNEHSSLTHLQARFGEHVDPNYVGWNMQCPDHTTREPEWAREFHQYERNGDLPGLSIVYLPSDHTQGSVPHKATAESYMADNDLALGKLVQTVSHSSYWRSTAIFVLEDDSQDGPDHVDPHRSVALVISPYTQHATVDSTHYDTAAMLATIEGILGLSPMSSFDQRATPMWKAFGSWPIIQPYRAIQPTVIPFGDPGYPRNTKHSPMAAWSARQNFSAPDGPNEDMLGRAIWESIRGKGAHPR
jgi:YVTN family beta-propeller protein